MANRCSAADIHPNIHELMSRLFYKGKLTESDISDLTSALDSYYDIECYIECKLPFCPYVKPCDWAEFLGYTSLSDVLDYYDHESGVGPVKKKDSIDTLDANWIRRPGHYSP